MKVLVVDYSIEIRDRLFSALSNHPGIEQLHVEQLAAPVAIEP